MNGIGLTNEEKKQVVQKIDKMMEGCPLSQLEKAWICNSRPPRAALEYSRRVGIPYEEALRVVDSWADRVNEEFRLRAVIDETRRA